MIERHRATSLRPLNFRRGEDVLEMSQLCVFTTVLMWLLWGLTLLKTSPWPDIASGFHLCSWVFLALAQLLYIRAWWLLKAGRRYSIWYETQEELNTTCNSLFFFWVFQALWTFG